jgi:hypothetical protein
MLFFQFGQEFGQRFGGKTLEKQVAPEGQVAFPRIYLNEKGSFFLGLAGQSGRGIDNSRSSDNEQPAARFHVFDRAEEK